MAKGGHYLSKSDLRERIKDIEARIKMMDRRDKALGELRAWLAKRHLTPTELLWMYRQMQPKRADKPVKSRKPLRAGEVSQRSLKSVPKNSNGNYRVGAGKTYRGSVKNIKYLSPDGQFVWGGLGRQPDWFQVFVKAGNDPELLLLNKPRDGAKTNGKAPAEATA